MKGRNSLWKMEAENAEDHREVPRFLFFQGKESSSRHQSDIRICEMNLLMFLLYRSFSCEGRTSFPPNYELHQARRRRWRGRRVLFVSYMSCFVVL